MQKKIIALAIASALTVPAMAFADTSIYGVLDAGYANTGATYGGVKKALNAFGFSTMTSSRLGFTNTEELNGGNKAMIRIESSLGSNVMGGTAQSPAGAPDFRKGQALNGTTLGDRELNASLMFSEGTTVKLGWGSTMIRDISLGYAPDPGGNLVGNVLNNNADFSSNRATGLTVTQAMDKLSVAVQLTNDTLKVDGNVDNKGSASAGSNSTTASNQFGNGYLIGAQYADGPLGVAAAYQNQESIAGAATVTSDVTRKIAVLAASFDLGVAKIIGEYGSDKGSDSVSGVSTKVSGESIGVQAPIGDILAFAQLSHGSNNDGVNGSRSISGYTVGGKYNMSKATYGYLSVGNIKTDAGGALSEFKVDQFALGMVHTF